MKKCSRTHLTKLAEYPKIDAGKLECMNQGKARAIAAIIRQKIEDGEYGAENPLPSVRTLARTYSIAHSTAHRVLNELSAMGLARTRRGSGMCGERVNLMFRRAA